MTQVQRDYKKAMVAWAREIAKWQLANPDKDWRNYINAQQADSDIGGNPPPPPPPPPGN